MRKYLLTFGMNKGGGAEKQIKLLLDTGYFEKLILLENDCQYDIHESKFVTLSNHTKSTSPFLKIFFIPIYAFRLAKILGRNENTSVISFMERASYVNILAKIYCRHRAIVNLQVHPGMHYSQGWKRLNLPLIFLSYRWANLMTGNSKLMVKDTSDLVGIPLNRRQYIPNFYDIRAIDHSKKAPIPDEEEKIFSGSKTVLLVNRLTHQKIPWHALRIFGELLQRSDSDIKLVVLNDGVLRQRAESFSHELGMRTYSSNNEMELTSEYDVYFLGVKDNIHRYMYRCDVYIHPSQHEGSPNALIEALLSGAEVFASDCLTGPRELLAPHTDPSIRCDMPEFNAAGCLIPTFEKIEPFSRGDLTPVEKMWVDTILKKLFSTNTDSDDYLTAIERLREIHNVKNISSAVEKVFELEE